MKYLCLTGEKDKKERLRRLETGKENSEPLQIGASRPEARSARLARLASQISSWEDDLSHPSVVKAPEVDPQRKDRFGNLGRKPVPPRQRQVPLGDSSRQQVPSGSSPKQQVPSSKHQEIRKSPVKSGESSGKSGWDKAILDTLVSSFFPLSCARST
jgi:hypothetical protein